jgi:hypothetical protein
MVTSLSPPLSVGLIASTLRGHWSTSAEFFVFVALLDFRRHRRLRKCQRQCVAIVGLDRALEQPILHLCPHICPHVGLGTVRGVRESEIDFEDIVETQGAQPLVVGDPKAMSRNIAATLRPGRASPRISARRGLEKPHLPEGDFMGAWIHFRV